VNQNKLYFPFPVPPKSNCWNRCSLLSVIRTD